MSGEKKIESCSHHSGVGFRVEWRLAPHLDWGTEPMKALLRLIERETGGSILIEWSPGPYSLTEKIVGSERLIKPFVSEFDAHLLDMGLCQKLTAEAIIACLWSRWGSTWVWECIEWRVAALRYERKWNTWCDEPGGLVV